MMVERVSSVFATHCVANTEEFKMAFDGMAEAMPFRILSPTRNKATA